MSAQALEFGSVEIRDSSIVGVHNAQKTDHLLREVNQPRHRQSNNIGQATLANDDVHEDNRFSRRTAVKFRSDDLEIIDYGDAAILPSLINLHTHLEYSSLRCFDSEHALFDWIEKLVGHVRNWSPEDFLNSALLGSEHIASSGTGLIADSSYSGSAAIAAARRGLRAVVGLELFGLHEKVLPECWQQWETKYNALLLAAETTEPALGKALEEGRIILTIAPHAPYSVSPELLRKAREWADNRQVPLMIHLSESASELAWLKDNDERLARFVNDFHGGQDTLQNTLRWRGKGQSPIEYLHSHGILDKPTLAAHVAHIDDNDIQLLAGSQTAVAHCPRSNARLRNGVAPVASMLNRNVKLGFGTDSAASTDNLDILSEARFAWNLQRAVYPEFTRDSEEAIQRLTFEAARMIGLSDVGALEPGKSADIAVFNFCQIHESFMKSPYDVLLFGNCELLELFVLGRKVVSKVV